MVHGEIVESLWEEDFTTVEDQQIVEDLRERLKFLGLDPSHAEEMVKKAQQPPLRKRSPSEPFLVQPQREWEEARKRINEQAKRLANILLNHVEFDDDGHRTDIQVQIPQADRPQQLHLGAYDGECRDAEATG